MHHSPSRKYIPWSNCESDYYGAPGNLVCGAECWLVHVLAIAMLTISLRGVSGRDDGGGERNLYI